jgi:hypothetical protein
MRAAGALLLAAVAAASAPFAVRLDSPSFVADAAFLSVSFDASTVQGANPFGFFSSARVDALLAGLAPLYLRFSGTAIDALLFNATGECGNGAKGAAGFCLNATQVGAVVALAARANASLVLGVNGKHGKNASSPNAPWDSANAELLLAWLADAIAADPAHMVAPVAFEIGNVTSTPRPPAAPATTTLTTQPYARPTTLNQQEPDLWGFGSEGHAADGGQLARDVEALRALVARYPALAPAGGGPLRSFGPDSCNCWHCSGSPSGCVFEEFAAALEAAGTTANRSLTFHLYNSGGEQTPYTMTSVELADRVAGLVAQARSYLVGRPMASAMPLIIGETGECVRGGCEGPPENATASLEVGAAGGPIHPSYSESFVDGFLYLDKLGLTAALNVSAIMKEKLFGSNDGLVNALLYPQPPYWVSLVHKQLVGPRVLAVANSTAPGRTLRVYAQCARSWGAGGGVPSYPRGSIVLIVVNLDANATSGAEVVLTDAATGAPVPLVPRDEYRFSGPLPAPLPGHDASCFFQPQHGLAYLPGASCLNGRLLYMGPAPGGGGGANTTLPALAPATVAEPGARLLVPPVFHGLFVLPNAAAPACM